jgi:Cu-Zn family superoxide dismutase
MITIVFLAACGGSSSKPREAKAPAAAPEHASVAEEPAEEAIPEPSEATYAAAPTDTETPEPAPTVDAPADDMEPPVVETATDTGPVSVTARATLASVKDGSEMGTITFTTDPTGGVMMEGQFNGLKKNGAHAFYIHENGDCSKKAKKVGKHLNPTGSKHGPPSSSTRHAGDFGDLAADDAGNAVFEMTTDSVTMEEGRPDSILHRAVVIYAKKDNKKGNAGAPLACGVIEIVTE